MKSSVSSGTRPRRSQRSVMRASLVELGTLESPPITGLETELRAAMSGEVRADAYTLHLFSRDASMYSIKPLAVVFPRDAADVAAAVGVCARRQVPMLPRGAGTSRSEE